MLEGKTYTEVTEAADITDEIIDMAMEICDGWYLDSRIDWEDVFDRMDGSTLNDSTTLDMGSEWDSPAMRKIKRAVNKVRREN